MPNKLTKLPVTEFNVGQEAYAGSPAYCYVTGVVRYAVSGASEAYLTQPMTPAEAYMEVVRKQSQTLKGITANYRAVCFPAIPPRDAVQSVSRVDPRPGWNAAADSVVNSEGDFSFTFEYPRFPVGIVVGVAPYPSGGTLPSSVVAGVLLRNEAIEVLAAGVAVAVAPYSPADAKRIIVSRLGNSVSVSVGDWSHTVEGVVATGAAQVRSLLYLAGEFVDTPRFIDVSVGRAKGSVGFLVGVSPVSRARGGVGFRAPNRRVVGRLGLVGSASAVEDFSARAVGSVAMRGVATPPSGVGELRVSTLSVLGGSLSGASVGAARVSAPALQVEAGGGYPIPVWAGGAVALPGLAFGGVVQVGEVATGEAQLPLLSAIGADYPYGQGVATLPALSAFGWAPVGPDGYVNMYEGVEFGASVSALGVMYASIRSELGVGSTVTFALLLEAAMYDSLLLDSKASLANTLEVVMRAGLLLSDKSARGGWAEKNAHYAAVQYATNVLTGAVTRMEGFNFSSFCRVGQLSFGVAPEGLYELGAYDDPVDAVVEFAAVGAETVASKNLQYVYVGLATDGEVYVRVTGDNQRDKVYRAVGGRDMFRAKCAGGLRARQWTVRLELVGATQATLDSIEWIAPATNRRGIK